VWIHTVCESLSEAYFYISMTREPEPEFADLPSGDYFCVTVSTFIVVPWFHVWTDCYESDFRPRAFQRRSENTMVACDCPQVQKHTGSSVMTHCID
jgi:hypothetical protein